MNKRRLPFMHFVWFLRHCWMQSTSAESQPNRHSVELWMHNSSHNSWSSKSLKKRLCFWVSPGLIKLIIENAYRTYGQEWSTRDTHAERCNKIQIRLKVICEKLYSDSLPQIIYISKQDTWVVSIRTWNFQMLCSHWNHCVQSLNSNAV